MKEIVIQSRDTLKEISGAQSKRTLSKLLGKETEDFNEIITLLKEADKKLGYMDNNQKEDILKGIWEYQAIDILNDTKGNLNNTLDIFIKDIYKDSFHFFLELIQNADDASKGGIEHVLSIIIDKDKNIIFEYDERGFDFSDIFAITSLGNSTKKAQLEDNADIGEKGIGFKSIFAIVKKIEIKSKYFSFDIELRDKRSSILEPAKLTLETSEKTSLKLILNEEAKTEKNLQEIHNWMKNNVECDSWDNPFLFLKNITRVNYKNELDDGYVAESTDKKKKDIDDRLSLVQLHNKKYILYTEEMVFEKPAIESRWEHLKEQLKDASDYKMKRPVQIAFPIDVKEETSGKIYSYLPTNIQLNFPVFINLDVHLTASRGNISESDFADGSLWNEQVKKSLPQFLINAYEYIISKYNDGKMNYIHIINDLCESFYKYIPIDGQQGMYKESLDRFKNEIKDKAIILTNEHTFKTQSDIRGVSSNLCQYDCSKAELIDSIYKFNGINTMKQSFPKDIRWNEFAKDIGTKESYNIYDFVENQGGIKKYWNKDSVDKREVLQKVIGQLDEGWVSFQYNNDTINERINELEIIPVEKDRDFELCARNKIVNILFSHSENQTIEEKKKVSYVYEGDSEIRGLKSLVCKIFDIRKYDLKDYFRKQVEELGNEINIQKVNHFIHNTFVFYDSDPKCFSADDISEPMKDFLDKYTFSIEEWKLYSGENVNKDYLEAVIKTEGCTLNFFNIPESIEEQSKSRYIEYLMFLGIKHKLTFKGGNLDIESRNLIQKTVWYYPDLDEEMDYMFNNNVQKYLLMQINEHASKINIDTLRDYGERLGLFLYDKDNQYTFSGKEIFVIESDEICKLTNAFNEKNGRAGQLSDSVYTIISYDYYGDIWNKLSENGILLVSKDWENRKKDKRPVRHFFQQSSYWNTSDWLTLLRRTKLLNSYFKNNYAWGYDTEDKKGTALPLSLEAFLKCHKELKEEGLGELMTKGYCISSALETASDFFGREDIVDFTSKINLDIKDFSNHIDQFNLDEVSIHSSEGADDIISFDGENNKTESITRLILQQKDNSTTLFKVYESYGMKNLPTHIKKEIQDYFGELRLEPAKITTLLTTGNNKYCEEVFFDFHIENIEKANEELVSIWDKRISEQLCNPFQLTDRKYMEGYGYVCPICGEKSLSALEGIKFGRFKHVGKGSEYLYIVSCLNCHSMLNYAKSITINDLESIIKEFKNCYCADDKHIKNHSAMHTVDLKIETWDGEIKELRMKISYLNMVLYLNNE